YPPPRRRRAVSPSLFATAEAALVANADPTVGQLGCKRNVRWRLRGRPDRTASVASGTQHSAINLPAHTELLALPCAVPVATGSALDAGATGTAAREDAAAHPWLSLGRMCRLAAHGRHASHHCRSRLLA